MPALASRWGPAADGGLPDEPPVLDAEQRLVGIIAREDIMRALTESARR
jgi:hypothetical protein